MRCCRVGSRPAVIQFQHRLELVRFQVQLVDVRIVRFVAVAVRVFLRVEVILGNHNVVHVLERLGNAGTVITVEHYFEHGFERVGGIQRQTIYPTVLGTRIVGVGTRVVLARYVEIHFTARALFAIVEVFDAVNSFTLALIWAPVNVLWLSIFTNSTGNLVPVFMSISF